MLLVRYFLYVGGVLVVLLLAANVFAPKPAVVSSADSGFDRSVIRIHSEQKLPERVVFDTTAPVIAAVPAAPIVASAPPAPANANVAMISPTARVRETFAQFVPAAEPKKPQVKAKAVTRVATRAVRSRVAAPEMRFAQQQRFGFASNNFGFAGNNIW
jgi:hypothetical protein